MCTNYRATRRELFAESYGVEPPADDWREDVYRDYAAPILCRGAGGGREARLATFGMVPHNRIPPHVRDYDTMNARTETIAMKRSFSSAWKACHVCLVPAQAVYEPRYPPLPAPGTPDYEVVRKRALAAKSERWGIALASGGPFAVAGLWRAWPPLDADLDDRQSLSFTMCTVDAESHAVFSLFHKHLKPDGTPNERRAVVILRPEQYDDWLGLEDPEQARSFFGLLPAEQLAIAPAPRPPRTSKKAKNVDE